MIAEAQVTTRNAWLLVVQRGAQVASGFLFAIFIPRLMGPDTYGQYALIASLSVWFMLVSTLGFTQVLARYVPQFMLARDKLGIQALFDGLLTVQFASGAAAALLYFLLTVLWLHEIDPLVLALMAGVVFLRALAHFLFALFLGLNQAARWGMGQIVHGWVSLALLVAGFAAYGLPGACLGLLLTEVVTLSVGIWWARPQVSRPHLHLDLRSMSPYLRFGLFFFASDLLLSAYQRSGPTMVQLFSHDYSQVGYFGLAHEVYLTAAAILPQLTLSFAPLLTSLRTQGQIEVLQRWIERLLKVLTVGGMLAVLGALLLADDLVPLVLGAAYRPVAVNLLPLMFTLPVLALGSVAQMLALVYDRPRLALSAAGVRLAAFWCLGPLLVAWKGDLGCSLAVLVAFTLYAAYFTWRMRRVVPYSLRSWALAIVLGGLFLPLGWLRPMLGIHSSLVDVALFCAFVIGYGTLLLRLRVVTPDEIASTWRAIGLGRRSPKWSDVTR
jgi:O-antigen/teichoic acid export membrane protein